MKTTKGLEIAFLWMLLVLSRGLAEEVRFQPLDERWGNEGWLNFTGVNKFRCQRGERGQKHAAWSISILKTGKFWGLRKFNSCWEVKAVCKDSNSWKMLLSLVKDQNEILAEFEEGQMLRSARYIWRKQQYDRVCRCIQPLTDLPLAMSKGTTCEMLLSKLMH